MFWQRVRLPRSAVAGPGSRLEQIVDWCGGEAFDGALVLDECHVGTGSPVHRLAVLNLGSWLGRQRAISLLCTLMFCLSSQP